jgi:hypothetical protein
MEDWLTAGNIVANEANDEESKKLMRRLSQKTILSLPIPKENIKDDEKISAHWEKLSKKPENIALIIKNEMPIFLVENKKNLSQTWKGIAVIHRAFYIFSKKVKPNSLENIAKEELEAYTISIRLINKIGGSKYQKYLNEKVEEFKRDTTIPQPTKYSKDLDDILGKAISKDEYALRDYVFLLNVIFRYSESLPESSKEQFKIDSFKKSIADIYPPL